MCIHILKEGGDLDYLEGCYLQTNCVIEITHVSEDLK
jgi:hypothetical protein